ncbi:hypothetical protein FQN57_006577 [Myotisia sp. PD_48]|nr:hypothetical protein FQN57_006577 [Myotisia sp. PD_48]
MSLLESVGKELLRRAGGASRNDHCTFETCDIEDSWFKYRPSITPNATFTLIFSISAIVFLIQGLRRRLFTGFMIAMVLGNIGEAIGYIGRIQMWGNPWKATPFMMQICCLTFAPAFLAAGIYLLLARIVVTFGRDNSRIPPQWYPRIFIPCDILALILQSAGGALASADTGGDIGKDVMIAGLVFQVITLSAFLVLAGDFAFRTYKRVSQYGAAALDPRHAQLRSSRRFHYFIAALSLSTICIFIRCVFRVAELAEGWDGPLMRNEGLFIGLEGVMIIIAVVVLNIFHPASCFTEGYNSEITVELKKPKGGHANAVSRWKLRSDSDSETA